MRNELELDGKTEKSVYFLCDSTAKNISKEWQTNIFDDSQFATWNFVSVVFEWEVASMKKFENWRWKVKSVEKQTQNWVELSVCVCVCVVGNSRAKKANSYAIQAQEKNCFCATNTSYSLFLTLVRPL